jgi:hypothetical protein
MDKEARQVMAQAIPPTEWLNAEESMRNDFYWQYLVETWLWQARSAIPPRPAELRETGREVPSVEALQDFGYVMVPESTVSH